MSDPPSEVYDTGKSKRLTAEELARLSSWLDEIPLVPPGERSVWFRRIDESSRKVLDAVWEALVESSAADAIDDFLPPLLPDHQASVEPELKAGDRFGPYVLLDRIGEGGMGVVWRAHRQDMLRNRVVAIKLPAPDSVRELTASWLAAERDILARLSHPGIGRLYDAGVSESGLPYLAMEYVDGLTLMEHLRSSSLDVDATLEIFIQIIDAVEYAHSMGVAHLDLKPRNVIVTRDKRPILLDFGVARLLAGGESGVGTVPQATALTPAYAAPELLCGSGKGRPADIYSLGVLLYEAMTGRQPFPPAGLSNTQLADRIRTAPPLLPSLAALDAPGRDRSERKALSRRLRRRLDAVIARAMHPQPEERHASAGALKTDLRRCLLASRSPMAMPANPWTRWSLVWGAALLTITLIVGASVDVHLDRVRRTEQLADERLRALDSVLDLLADAVAQRMQEADSKDGIDLNVVSQLIYSFENRHPQAFAGSALSKLDLYRKLADIQQTKGHLSVAQTLHDMRVAETRKAVAGSNAAGSTELAAAMLDSVESCLLSSADPKTIEPCTRRLEEVRTLLSRAPTHQAAWRAQAVRAHLLGALAKAFDAPDQAALLLDQAEAQLGDAQAEGQQPKVRVVQGIVAGSNRRWAESLRLLEEASRSIGTSHAWFPLMQANICEAHHRMAQLRLAEAACERLHALEAHNHTGFNTSAAWTVYLLSSIHISLGEFGRAEKLLIDSIARAHKAGNDIKSTDFSHLYERLARASIAYGNLEKAAIWVAYLPRPSAAPLDAWACAYLGAALELNALRGGAPDSKADEELERRKLRECGDGVESTIGPAQIRAMNGHWQAALDLISAHRQRKPSGTAPTDAMGEVQELELSIIEAQALLELGRHDESAAITARLQNKIRESANADVNRLFAMELAELRGRLLLAQGNPADALPWLYDAMRMADALLSPGSPVRLRVLCSLADAQWRGGDRVSALAMLVEAQRGVDANHGRLAESVLKSYRALKSRFTGAGAAGAPPG